MAAEWQDRGDNSERKLPLLDHVDVFYGSRDDILILCLVYRPGHVNYCLSFLYCNRIAGFIQGSLSKIQGLFKDFSRLFTSFQGLKEKDGSVKILLQKC